MRLWPISCRCEPNRSFGETSRSLLVPVLILLAATAPACAAGDSAAGQRLTQQWCTGCHAVARGGEGTDSAPPLPTIAQHQGTDRRWLRAWLAAPHPPMPNLNLSQQEIENVTAYLESLTQP